MGTLSNVYDSFTAIGNREDLTDFITNVSPLEAPAYDRWGTIKAAGRYHEYQTDTLAAAAENAKTEGESFAAAARTATTRYGNHCQIFVKQFTVSDTQNVVDKAGRKSESAYQMTKAAKELKRDFEYAIMLSAADTRSTGISGAASVAPMFANAWSWQIKVLAHTGISGATAATITESEFNKELQNAWANGARVNTVYCNGGQKRLFSGWGTSTSRPRQMAVEGKKISNVIDYYESDFGEMEIVLDRYVASVAVMVLDDNLWRKANLVPVTWVTLAKRGLGTDHMLWSQWTLEARNPTGNQMLYTAP